MQALDRKDAEPDAYNRRIFRFCAGWLGRFESRRRSDHDCEPVPLRGGGWRIAEAALLPPINPWTVGNFCPRYFQPTFSRARRVPPGQGTGRLDTVPPDDLLDNALAIGSPHVDAEREMCAGYCHRFCLSCRWQRFRW